VYLSGCHVTHSKGSANPTFHVQYMNNGKVAVDEIRFTTDFGSGNKPRTFTDKGTFEPGTMIMRSFNLASHSHAGIPSKPQCTLQYVHFSDGTSWHAPSAYSVMNHRVLRSLKLPGFDLARRGDPLRIRPEGCRMHLPNDGLRTETLWRHLTI
jgi:hypothetical protein